MELPQINFYIISTCSNCKTAPNLLGEFGVHYEFTDVDLMEGEERAAILDDVKKFNPRWSFPTIITV